LLNVRGDLLSGTNQTAEVFRTVAPATGLTYWRMFQGGTAPAFERAQLYALPGVNHFNINTPNRHFQLHTQSVQRARLNGNVTSAMGQANQFTNVNRDGFLVLSGAPDAFVNVASRAPFTRLHLVDPQGGATNPVDYAQQFGYRPWMRNGITFTGNKDQSYVGHKYDVNPDNTDFVVQWSDNPNGSPWGVDRMKFVFSTEYNPSATKGAATLAGMEAMRFWPQSNTSVNVGVGDFAPVTVGDPTERLDILDGRLRIRQLPDDPPANYLTKVMVVEDFPLIPGERGVVKWRDASTLGNPCASGWNLVGSNPVTAYNGNPCPPQAQHLVGIGTSNPAAKLHVVKSIVADPLTERGIWMQMTTTAANNVGVESEVTGTTNNNNFGVRSRAQNAIRNWGVFSDAVSTAQTSAFGVETRVIGTGTNYGFVGSAIAGANNTGLRVNAAGLAGSLVNTGISAGASGPNALAGDFIGTVQANAFVTISDQMLKSDVQSLSNATDVLRALEPRSYDYAHSAYPAMELPTVRQFGFVAQEVEEVLPQLVRTVVRLNETEDGSSDSAPFEFKTLNYIGLIPWLVAGFQEQQDQLEIERTIRTELEATVQELAARLDLMEQQLGACCDASDSGGQRTGLIEPVEKAIEGDGRMLRIVPNPFSDPPTIHYSLERSGRMQLLVNSSDGKHLKVLEEGERSEGQYSHAWQTSQLAPGIYYVTLLLDGEPLVKRAVKVQ
jgi:hypothetical protein